jgi:hypothetical protein
VCRNELTPSVVFDNFLMARLLPNCGTIVVRSITMMLMIVIRTHVGVGWVMAIEPPSYRAFMLRCWEVRRSEADEPVTWRFSLEDAHTGQKYGFADIEAVLEFLSKELAEQS